MSSVVAPLRDGEGRSVGELTVRRLPGRNDRLELDGERIVLEEEGTYGFAIETVESEAGVELQPSHELFSFDDDSCRTGRLSPRQHVGRIRLLVRSNSASGSATLSVRPRKLDEEHEYRQMLNDIADVATEAILQGFAPAAAALTPDTKVRPELLYQQFAFLHARLMGHGDRDLALILHRPHTAWRDDEEHRSPGAPLRGGTRNIRALSRPGPRVPTPDGHAVPHLPVRIATVRSEETLDTEPNRFVLFALQRWRQLAQRVLDLLSAQAVRSGPVSRGVDAAEEVIELLDRTMHAPMFREVGRLRSFPSGNQVLQKRAGYRELLRTFALTETGARLSLEWDLEDVFGASQRNIATLYEYWVFLALARVVGTVCGDDLSARALQTSTDGMSLGFVRGKASALRWKIAVHGRDLSVELFFNREFLVSALPDSSWSRAMRPDCSVRIEPEGINELVSGDELSVWVHFDAKYRVEFAEGQFSKPSIDDGEAAAEAEVTERLARSKREDLLKMHAYRDAIRRSAGAYVLYPGDQHHDPFVEHHEVLPGLGAFVLRPSADGTRGTEQLGAFLKDVLGHVADRASQHERSRFWGTVIHERAPRFREADRRLPSLDAPPSDSLVLCGYVRSNAQLAWIDREGLYNVRAGNRRGAVGLESELLAADDLVLYGPSMQPRLFARAGAWFVQSRDDLEASGYPKPGGAVYLCCPVERRFDEPAWLPRLTLADEAPRGGPIGAPFAVTWQRLLEAGS